MRVAPRLLAFTFILAAFSSCDQQPAGEPIVRTSIRASDGTLLSSAPAQDGASAAEFTAQIESSCRPVIFEDASFTHCLAVPSRHRITVALAGTNGTPFRDFATYARGRGQDAPTVAFAMNGGMFDEDGQPIGYFVEDAERLQTLNTRNATGNFYLKPNGVFFGDEEKWQIRTTDDFLQNVEDRPRFGTQSGPMLVINGKLHPEIAVDGQAKLIRNGVGVDDEGRAHFVISNAPVSFGKLARLYRDKLEVDNALYLDGSISALWSPASGRMDSSAPLGPLIVVEKKQVGAG